MALPISALQHANSLESLSSALVCCKCRTDEESIELVEGEISILELDVESTGWGVGLDWEVELRGGRAEREREAEARFAGAVRVGSFGRCGVWVLLISEDRLLKDGISLEVVAEPDGDRMDFASD